LGTGDLAELRWAAYAQQENQKRKRKRKENLYNPRNNYITTEISPTTIYN
jgi:hypothetical protein